MLFCIFVPHKAEPVLFLSRAVLLWTFPFPRKGFWHNVVLIKADFCSILFSFFVFFLITMQDQRIVIFYFFIILVVVDFFLFLYFFSALIPGQRLRFFYPHQQVQKSSPAQEGFAKPTCRAQISAGFRVFPVLLNFLRYCKKKKKKLKVADFLGKVVTLQTFD